MLEDGRGGEVGTVVRGCAVEKLVEVGEGVVVVVGIGGGIGGAEVVVFPPVVHSIVIGIKMVRQVDGGGLMRLGHGNS